MDRAIFYDEIRYDLFNGMLNQDQVDGMEAILNFWASPPITPTGAFKENWEIRNIDWLAYIFATTYHETAFTMQPITEYGDKERFTRLYEGREDLGNTEPGDGAKFRGRGYVQITGRRNYRAMTPIVQDFYPDSPDLTLEPEAAKNPKYAAVIMFHGMVLGTFTGKALKHYIGDPEEGQHVDFFHARKIINRLNKASTIRSYAEEFSQALNQSLNSS